MLPRHTVGKAVTVLTWTLLSPLTLAVEIPNGGSVAGMISVNGEVDTHTFEGIAGQQGVIAVSGNVAGGEFMTIFKPDSTQLATTSAKVFVDLPQTGTYTVEVRSFQPTGFRSSKNPQNHPLDSVKSQTSNTSGS